MCGHANIAILGCIIEIDTKPNIYLVEMPLIFLILKQVAPQECPQIVMNLRGSKQNSSYKSLLFSTSICNFQGLDQENSFSLSGQPMADVMNEFMSIFGFETNYMYM